MKYIKGEFTTVPSKTARRGLPPSQQVVYMWLCDYGGDDHKSFPSRKTLAEDCGISLRTLDSALKALEKLKLIDRQQRVNDGQYTTSIYTVNIAEGRAKSAGGRAEKDTTPRAESAQRTQPSINSTHLTQNDTNVSLAKAHGNPEINEMFDYWKQTVGYEITSKQQNNRNACHNLVRRHGKAGVEQLIRAVSATQNDKYAPRIADFVELQANFNKLMAWGKKQMLQPKGTIKV